MIRIIGMKMKPGFTDADLRHTVAAILKIKSSELLTVQLAKRSLDARKKNNLLYICAVDVKISGNEKKLVSRLRNQNVQIRTQVKYRLPQHSYQGARPVIVGFGPAGMFAGLVLAQCGLRPIILERGADAETRTAAVQAFWDHRQLNPSTNIQFGEGGAGTFSDGKLHTGTHDPRNRKVLTSFVENGAPDEILYEAKPHIGTDLLRNIVIRIRERITALGGTVRFHTQLTAIQTKNGAVHSIDIMNTESKQKSELPCDHLILAIGHSARDTFEQLYHQQIPMTQKPFSVGVRIEHLAEQIDLAQYGIQSRPPFLGAAEYKLSCHLANGRSVYTFCMCPGGYVTGAASEQGTVVTNGMSYYARDGINSNSAILVSVHPADFNDESPLAGVAFQRRIEQAAFQLGGGNYNAPIQTLGSFLHQPTPNVLGAIRPTYQPGAVFTDLTQCLPAFVCDSIREAIPIFASRLSGFDHPDALLTAPETRSSSPVRILRDETLQSPSVKGLFPCGEGAGYAGGIMSAAVDGIKCAEALLQAGTL